MKKLVYTAFVAFWASIFTLVSVQALSDHKKEPSDEESLGTYTLEEVAEHDSLDDCWMAIEGKVYDFSNYIPEHPTPPSVMKPWCGEEATEGMRTKGYGRDHSPAAWEMMEDYLVGRLKEE